MRADCPTSGKDKKSNLEPGGMESQTKPELGRGGGGVCQGGCGLRLTGEEHCCVDALRTATDTLEERSATLEHEARMARLRWNRREQYLLAQVSNLQNEAQLAALQYQRRLHQYMLHINSIAEQVTGYCKGDLRATCDKQSKIADTASSKEEEQLKAPEVNGKELSKSSHEETVEAFRAAKDPVVVQVIRRTPSGRPHGSPQEIRVVDVCTQTDITFEHIMALAKLRPSTPPVPDVCPFLLSDSCHSLHTMEQEYYDGTGYLSPVPADGERAEEFEYEEVELCRLSSQEKLGLTLCYRTDEEEDVAIYVSEGQVELERVPASTGQKAKVLSGQISPNSIAARDGRIREGDRILQINGQDVQDREEAMAALSNDECRNILLLVARPELQLEEDWLDDEHSEFLEQLKMEMLEEQQREEMELAALQEEDQENEQREEDDEPTCSTLPHKDNVQRIKDRTESSEHNVLAHIQRRLSKCLRDNGDTHRTGSSKLEDKEEEEDEEMEGDRFQQLLELKCQIRNSGEYDLFYSRRSTIECSVGEQGGMQHELRMLNEELRSIELECQNIMQAHNLRKGQQSPSTGPCAPSTKNQSLNRSDPTRGKLADINGRLEKSDKDSSSAYNTAESSRSTPLAMDRSPEHSLQRMVSLTNQRNLCSSLATGPSLSPSPVPACHAPVPGKSSSPDHSNPAKHTPQAEEESKGVSKPGASQIPYFSPSHSSQQRQVNIPAHARHYQSYMQLIQQRSAVEYAQSQLSLLSVCKEPQRPINEPKMEWKVKIRSDGTRYITKRPVRDKILRERALKIKEERSGGMTTDDDAMSEMKMGRYWSKEERKQHLVRAKEQRKRREFMQRSRLESLKENPQSSSEGRKEVSIIELSHKKMMKKRNKKILDNWMTIQELMTHGTKAPEGAKVHNAFLSVTTV